MLVFFSSKYSRLLAVQPWLRGYAGFPKILFPKLGCDVKEEQPINMMLEEVTILFNLFLPRKLTLSSSQKDESGKGKKDLSPGEGEKPTIGVPV